MNPEGLMKPFLFSFLVLVLFGAAAPAGAALQTKTIDYSYGGKTFKGYLAWDDAVSGKRPGVLVVHEWWGLNDYARSRTEQLAKAGYVAFAADMYGEGKVAAHPDQAGAMVQEVRTNLTEWLGRANAALNVLRAQPQVDGAKLAVIGYCFGGATALQLAFSGANIRLAASFHGSLPLPEKPETIKAKLLIYHGGKDSHVPAETVTALKAKLDPAKVDYRLTIYPEAMHGFSVPGADARGMKGVAYNAEADQKSWADLLAALKSL